MIIDQRTTYDCAPTLNDAQVLDFCKTGYLVLPATIDDAVNTRCTDWLEQHAQLDHSKTEAREAAARGHARVRISRVAEPMELFQEEWFVDNVLCAPAVVGAVRSLLGRDFGLPILISNHRMTPDNTPAEEQGWHHDGGSQFDATELNYLQVFYYPQNVTPEMGPTELCPGTHWGTQSYDPRNQGVSSSPPPGRATVLTAFPAGSVVITDYPILHRRAASSIACSRNLLKYNYWRTSEPVRDWRGSAEPFDFLGTDWNSDVGDFYSCIPISRRFFWLAAEQYPEKLLGGQGWPLTFSRANSVDDDWGYPGTTAHKSVQPGYSPDGVPVARVHPAARL
jgi:hypothetical protein